jgi:hypothetical protein
MDALGDSVMGGSPAKKGPTTGLFSRRASSATGGRGRRVSICLEQSFGDLLNFQRAPRRNDFPLINGLRGNAQHPGEILVSLAQRIQTLPAQDRAILLAMVESLTHAKQDRSHESEDLHVWVYRRFAKDPSLFRL